MQQAKQRTLTSTTECLKVWLKFPSQPINNLRYCAIDTILSAVPRSILLMEPMWRLYIDPVGLLMGVRRTARLTEVEFDKVIDHLKDQLYASGLLDRTSPIRMSLDVLSDLNALWVNAFKPKSI